MCQASTELPSKPQSDDDFQWEEFFGASVDISGSLLNMLDSMVASNGPSSASPPSAQGGESSLSPQQALPLAPRPCNKRSYSDTVFQDKKRPLSSSSVSSSSSSSSSSLPRNGLDVKKSYLASIESLDDDEYEEGGKQTAPAVPSSASAKPRWCDPNLSHTDCVLLEIVDTEKTYVRDLNQIIEGYLKPICGVNESKISKQQLRDLFSNIEDIYHFNCSFVSELECCGLNIAAVAECFVRNSNGFEVYTQYCTHYPRTVSVLTELMGNPETADVFKERQVALQHSLPLGSYLLKPVQRILKYHLLLQNMVKHLEKDCSGYCDVKNALAVMKGISYHINDMKRKHEHAVRVQEIQSLLYGWEGQDLTTYGELVAEGAFRMYRAKALRHLFLFDQMILIAKKKEEGILCYKTHIMCSNLMLIESIQGEPLCFHVIPFDNPRYQYTFQAKNLEQKREWCLQLKRVILENYNAVIPIHARQLVMELGQSRHSDSASERSTTKRQLSAPEYLEKRKQERRKSEVNFKLKKNLKKGDQSSSANNLSNGHRKSCYSDSHKCWTRSQEDVCHKPRSLFGRWTNSENISHSGSASNLSFARGTRARHSLPQPASNQKKSVRGYRFQPGWSSVVEETTDTENDDMDPPKHSYRDRAYSEASDDGFENSGEYVTFFHAHAYATRDMAQSDSEEHAKDKGHAESTSSWKQNAALRRVQSFTGMAKAKVAAIQHNISFRHSGEPKGKPKAASPPASHSDPADGSDKKSGSLPRSFILLSDCEKDSNCHLRIRTDASKSVHFDRPYTIASDSPSVADFGDDLDYVLLDYSNCVNSEYFFPSPSTPAESLEDVNAIHPELKIYHQSASKYAALKHILVHLGSKLADIHRSGSRSSIRSEHEPGAKNLPLKLAHSVAKALRYKKKQEIKITDSASKKCGSLKPENCVVGARMAQPLESEYGIPKYILSSKLLQDVRPDSLFSESSSSDGDKSYRPEPTFPMEDGASEASDTSADSYYERTFEEIENTLSQGIFRDSAIYSDPEDADFSAVEQKKEGELENTEPEVVPHNMCARRVTRAIMDRLCVLEEKIKVEGKPVVPKRPTHIDKSGNRDCEESETSSEHSCSTVNTVMELGSHPDQKSSPRAKGWVKHVVEKLQGEGHL